MRAGWRPAETSIQMYHEADFPERVFGGGLFNEIYSPPRNGHSEEAEVVPYRDQWDSLTNGLVCL